MVSKFNKKIGGGKMLNECVKEFPDEYKQLNEAMKEGLINLGKVEACYKQKENGKNIDNKFIVEELYWLLTDKALVELVVENDSVAFEIFIKNHVISIKKNYIT